MAAMDEGKSNLFNRIFARPTLQAMLDLSWQDFQHFVAHVFSCAGYSVQYVANKQFPNGPGVDLNLYKGPIKGKPVARVEVRKYSPENTLGYHDVTDFLGVLQVAGNIPGYLVTTSSFNDNAQAAADAVSDSVRLIDGRHLLRYITYVGGSRLSGQFDGVLLTPAIPTSPDWLLQADSIVDALGGPAQRARILVLANTKGGVAKTTSAINIACSLAEQHHQPVLLIDMDGQASLTQDLPRPLPLDTPASVKKSAPPPPDTQFLSDYFRTGIPLTSLVRPTRFPHLSLVPAHLDMRRLQFEGAERTKAELRFAEDLRRPASNCAREETEQKFDWIVVDTPAGESFYGRAALAAADCIVIPAYAESFAVLGIGEALTLADTMGALMGDTELSRRRILGCLLTRFKPGRVTDAVLGNLTLYLANESITQFKTTIPADDKIEIAHQATGAGGIRTLFRLTSQMSPAAKAYDQFVKEMLTHVNNRETPT